MIHEHQSSNKIIERIFRIYYFSKMKKQVEDIIRKCNVCICTKHNVDDYVDDYSESYHWSLVAKA